MKGTAWQKKSDSGFKRKADSSGWFNFFKATAVLRSW